ncbi:MAG: hypothetical protein ACYC4Q_03930 [Victivallaceae bacterium]
MIKHLKHISTIHVLTEKEIFIFVTFVNNTETKEILVTYSGSVSDKAGISETFSATLKGVELDYLRQACKEKIENNYGKIIKGDI